MMKLKLTKAFILKIENPEIITVTLFVFLFYVPNFLKEPKSNRNKTRKKKVNDREKINNLVELSQN